MKRSEGSITTPERPVSTGAPHRKDAAAPRSDPAARRRPSAPARFLAFAAPLAGFALGVTLTVGLLLSRHTVPGGWGHAAGRAWPLWLVVLVVAGGLAALALALRTGNRLIRGASCWREPRLVAGTVLIAAVANTLYVFLVELFALRSGMRALVAVLGLPVIYGYLGAVLGRKRVRDSMRGILFGALMTMGAGFIVAALIMGWGNL